MYEAQIFLAVLLLFFKFSLSMLIIAYLIYLWYLAVRRDFRGY